jgi:molybdopterin molybdotransferase
MSEFLTLYAPDEARKLLMDRIPEKPVISQIIETEFAFGRITAGDVFAPHPLPAFPRSTVDGYAVIARDTYGASESLPGYLGLTSEVPMGSGPTFSVLPGQCALIHTGGMLPGGANAIIMLEYTQAVRLGEIEILRAVAEGENVIRLGEDVAKNQLVISRGVRIRAAEIGGLMALGITRLPVVKRVRVALISSGDEVIEPHQDPQPGQVRDINTYTLSAVVTRMGGEPIPYGIVKDNFETLRAVATKALSECDMVIITAGSSASTRDMTAEVISTLGKPGVLVHGINTRPGKPTILGVCEGKAVIGLPGNPVSALVNGYIFGAPLIEKLLGITTILPKPAVRARLTINLPSQAGREDWQPVKLASTDAGWDAEPIFGKSNLIFSLAAADGLVKINVDANGIGAGEMVDVILME